MSKKKRSTKDTVEALKEAAATGEEMLTPKQEGFIQAYLECGNASEAYRRAYNAENMAAETIHVKACELLAHGKVSVRISAYRAMASKRAALTVQTILDELDQARLLALKLEQPASMVTASMGRAKVGGLIVDKKEVGPANAFDAMSDDELRKWVMEEAKALGLTPPATSSRANGTKH